MMFTIADIKAAAPVPTSASRRIFAANGGSGMRARVRRLHGANLHRLAQRREGIAHRDEFLGHESLEPGGANRPRDRRIMQLLRVVDFVTSGIPTGVVMGEILVA